MNFLNQNLKKIHMLGYEEKVLVSSTDHNYI
jgi:hypothetical protein